jgi:signal peptidase I
VKTAEPSTAEGPPRPEAEHRHPVIQFLLELPGLLLMAFALALFIKTFLVQAFFIPSGSMVPTLTPGDRVLVVKAPYWFGEPSRGDIIVFERTDRLGGGHEPDRGVVGGFFDWLGEGLGFQPPENPDYIKRVIGLPGDVVSAKNGKVLVNGRPIEEPYLTQRTADFARTEVPNGKLFVMGDNRANSLDSRAGLGFVPIDDVVGKAYITVWPIPRANLLD